MLLSFENKDVSKILECLKIDTILAHNSDNITPNQE